MKKIIVLIIIFFTILFLNFLYFKTDLVFIKNKFPNEVKKVLKETVFIIPNLKKEIEVQKNIANNQIEAAKILKNELIEVQQIKGIVNEKIFPQTQFVKLSYFEIPLNISKNYERDGKKVSPFYLELYNNNILVTSKDGKISYASIKEIPQYKFGEIKNNISNLNHEVTDVLIDDEIIYIASHDKNKDCNNFQIFSAKLNLRRIYFEKIYETGDDGKCSIDAFSGKIHKYNFEGKNGLLIIARDNNSKNLFLSDQYQDGTLYKYSSVFFLNLSKKVLTPFAGGLRNVQGLIVTKNNNIISSSHGPRGGDELNNLKYGKNYGWPYVSYGENYYKSLIESDAFEYKKNHENFGFSEPIFSFVPSIAPTEIIEIDKDFSSKWNENLLLATLRSQSLFRLVLTEDKNKVLSYEQIRIGKRVRDMVYDKKNKIIFIAQEDDTGSIGVISTATK
jgi:hypothetical protein